MRLNIFAKLIGGFGIVLLLMGVVGWMGINAMSTTNSYVDIIYNDHLIPLKELATADQQLQRMRGKVAEYLLYDDKADIAEAEKKIGEHEKNWLAALDKFSKSDLEKEERDLISKVNTSWSAYRLELNNLIQLKAQGKDHEAQDLLKGALRQKLDPVLSGIDELTKMGVSSAEEYEHASETTYNQNRTIQLGLIALAVLLGLGIALYLARSISSSVGKMALAAKGIAAGDLNQIVDVRSRDEVGDLANAFREMIDYLKEMAGVAEAMADGDLSKDIKPKSDKDILGNAFNSMIVSLRGLISQVAESAMSVTSASEQLSQAANQSASATQQISTTIQEVAKGSQNQSATAQTASRSVMQLTQAIDQIAKGAQEQSRAIQDTSSAVAKMSESIDEVSGTSQMVTQAAVQSQELARGGATVVNRSIEGMVTIKDKVGVSAQRVKELGEYSDQIGKIVETIDDIAEQTNLLALNAAIEAARAGEHGKGFAVVADEVRKLAERAARATREITQIIGTVQKGTVEAVQAMADVAREVESGSKLSSEAGDALQNILQGAAGAAGQMQGIVQSLTAMTQLSQEVVRSIESVSSVVEENTAATEEMAAGATEVAEAIDTVASVSEQTAASTEEVSAGAEEMTAQVEEMVASSKSLAEMAEGLQEMVSRFKLEENAQRETMKRRRKDDWGKDIVESKDDRRLLQLKSI